MAAGVQDHNHQLHRVCLLRGIAARAGANVRNLHRDRHPVLHGLVADRDSRIAGVDPAEAVSRETKLIDFNNINNKNLTELS